MTTIPITLTDISLLFAMMSIILFAISEWTAPEYGQTSFVADKKRLRQAAWWTGILFILATGFQILQLLPTLI